MLMILLEIGLRIFWSDKTNYSRTYPGQYKNKEIHVDTNLVDVTWPLTEKDLGWVCKKNKYIPFSNKKYKDLKVEYVINNQGFRNTNDYDTACAQNNNTRVMLLGDSFIFGVFLDEKSTISSKLQEKLGSQYNVYNMGMPGWGIDQMYLAYKKYEPIIKPQIIVLMFIEDDIPRVLEAYRKVEGMNKPSYDLENGELMLRSSRNNSPEVIIKVLEYSKLLNPFYKRYLKFKSDGIVKKIFADLITCVKLNNQRLIVIRCPRVDNLLQIENLEDHDFIQSLKDTQVFYYELYDDIKKMSPTDIGNYYIKDDGHLSPEGSEYVAEKISSIVLRMDSIKLDVQ